MGCSRDTFYRIKKAHEEGGVEALRKTSRRRPNLRNRVPEDIEQAVVEFAYENPSFGQRRASDTLRRRGVFISAAGIRCVWLRHELETFPKWLKALEQRVARTKAKSPQTNRICERFQKTVLDEFYRIAFRRKIYSTLEVLQRDLYEWLKYYNTQRPHKGKRCQGKTPMTTFLENLTLAKEKLLDMNNGGLPMAA